MKHVLIQMMVSLALFLADFGVKAEPPKDFGGFKEWMDTAPLEERKEHFENMSANYTLKHGEEANKLRLCTLLDQNWKGLDLWVDQKWRKLGIRLLDDKRYTDWIVNADKGTKPWLIMFANTVYSSASIIQPTDNMMRNLACLAAVYSDTFNFGIMDYRLSEKVFENYDMRLDYGKATPALILFDSGKAYPADTGTTSAIKLAGFMANYTEGDCQFCGQTVKAPQTELTLYLEYAKNEVSGAKVYHETYNFFQDNYNETWAHQNFIQPYFGPKLAKKVVGERIIFWIIVPSILNGLVIFYMTLSCMCKCICGKGSSSEVDEAQKTSAERNQQPVQVEMSKKKQQEAATENTPAPTASKSTSASSSSNKKKNNNSKKGGKRQKTD